MPLSSAYAPVPFASVVWFAVTSSSLGSSLVGDIDDHETEGRRKSHRGFSETSLNAAAACASGAREAPAPPWPEMVGHAPESQWAREDLNLHGVAPTGT